jgi:hypothetical protein
VNELVEIDGCARFRLHKTRSLRSGLRFAESPGL